VSDINTLTVLEGHCISPDVRHEEDQCCEVRRSRWPRNYAASVIYLPEI